MRKLSAPHFDQFSYWLLSWIFCIVTILTHSLRRCSFYILTLFRFANDKQFPFGSGIACQDWPGTSFSPTLAQIVPWMMVSGTSNWTLLIGWKWNLGKAECHSKMDRDLQKWWGNLPLFNSCPNRTLNGGMWVFKSDTSNRLKEEFGQGSLPYTAWPSFSKLAGYASFDRLVFYFLKLPQGLLPKI